MVTVQVTVTKDHYPHNFSGQQHGVSTTNFTKRYILMIVPALIHRCIFAWYILLGDASAITEQLYC
jgi:hypothetical protein